MVDYTPSRSTISISPLLLCEEEEEEVAVDDLTSTCMHYSRFHTKKGSTRHDNAAGRSILYMNGNDDIVWLLLGLQQGRDH